MIFKAFKATVGITLQSWSVEALCASEDNQCSYLLKNNPQNILSPHLL